MIYRHTIDDARNMLAEILGDTEAPYLLVVPDSIGLGDNPAITIKKQIHAGIYQKQLSQESATKYVHEELRDEWSDLVGKVGVNTILVQEGAVMKPAALARAIIWHEYGHVIYDAAETGRVYLHEVTCLTEAVDRLGKEKVGEVVRGRLSQYKKAVDPGVEALRNYLGLHWEIAL